MLSHELASLQLSDVPAAPPSASVDGRGGTVGALSLPAELWRRIVAFDDPDRPRSLGRRLAHETTVRLVSRSLADIVIATAPFSSEEGSQTTVRASERGLRALARIADRERTGDRGQIGALRRLFLPLAPRDALGGGGGGDDVAECLASVIGVASKLVDLEIVLAGRPLTDDVVDLLCALSSLQTLSLRECEGTLHAVGRWLGNKSLRSLETDHIWASRVLDAETPASWAVRTWLRGLDGVSVLHGLLDSGGRHFYRLQVDVDFDLAQVNFASGCPGVRHIDLRVSVVEAAPLRLPRLASARLLSQIAWRHLPSLLGTGARSIEVGPSDAVDRSDDDLVVAALVEAMHRTSPCRAVAGGDLWWKGRPDFLETTTLCRQLSNAFVASGATVSPSPRALS